MTAARRLQASKIRDEEWRWVPAICAPPYHLGSLPVDSPDATGCGVRAAGNAHKGRRQSWRGRLPEPARRLVEVPLDATTRFRREAAQVSTHRTSTVQQAMIAASIGRVTTDDAATDGIRAGSMQVRGC